MNIYVIPDDQSKKGVRNPLIAVAHHICEIKPDYVVHLGDHWDMPSLSSYDKGKKSHRPKSYYSDMKAGNDSMKEFWQIIKTNWKNYKKKCKFVFHMGNHEDRRKKAIEYCEDEYLELIESIDFDTGGWKVVPFLKINKIKGVNFSHYFQNNNSHRPISSARQILNKKHESCVAGHMQGFEYAEQMTSSGVIQAIIAGSCYYHKEHYKPQSNHHWRGTVLLKNVKNGCFEFNRYSLNNLTKKYL